FSDPTGHFSFKWLGKLFGRSSTKAGKRAKPTVVSASPEITVAPGTTRMKSGREGVGSSNVGGAQYKKQKSRGPAYRGDQPSAHAMRVAELQNMYPGGKPVTQFEDIPSINYVDRSRLVDESRGYNFPTGDTITSVNPVTRWDRDIYKLRNARRELVGSQQEKLNKLEGLQARERLRQQTH
ncbi:MAG: hypothetical protein RSC78_05370, partial [Acidaminococcaceae bacterium]